MKLIIEIDDTDSRFAAVLAVLNGTAAFVPSVSIPSTDEPKTRKPRVSAKEATIAAFEAMKAQDAAKVLTSPETITDSATGQTSDKVSEGVYQDRSVVDADTAAEAARDAEALAADLAADEQKAIARQEQDAAARNADIGAAEDRLDDTRSRDELLAAVREMSHEGGALLLREIQSKYAVRSLSLLSDAQMREILA